MMDREIDKLIQLYRQEVLSRPSRRVSLLGRKCEPHIQDTFLGFELKAGRKRITCPDMATARFLRVFAELGMPHIEIPYDPTRTSRLAPRMEGCLERIKELLLQEKRDRQNHGQRLRRIYGRIRQALRLADAEG